MKKILIFTIVLTLIFSMFSISALALDEQAQNEIALPEGEAYTAEESEEENIFKSIFNAFEENSDKLFSSLSFICSIIIIFAYKKGFLPLFKKGLSAIGSTVKAVEAESQKQTTSAEALSEFLSSKMAECENILEKITETIGTLEVRLLKAETESQDRNAIFNAITKEEELLYEIFMSSALPEYEKERVAKKLSDMSLITKRAAGEENDS